MQMIPIMTRFSHGCARNLGLSSDHRHLGETDSDGRIQPAQVDRVGLAIVRVGPPLYFSPVSRPFRRHTADNSLVLDDNSVMADKTDPFTTATTR